MKQFKSKRRIKGQGMTEYIIIVGVIGIAAISVFGLFGDTVENQIAGMAQELAGGDGTAAQGAAEKSAGEAQTDAATKNNLKTYTGNNK
jgi:Flp pilus assembly pilin Flp